MYGFTAKSIVLSEPEHVNLLTSPGIDSQPGGIDSSESISGLLKRLQIRAGSDTVGPVEEQFGQYEVR